jgi:phosphoserine phosphatase
VTQLFVIFDVDSTLIEDEVIELLADAAGTREQVAEATNRAMAGEIDFAESLIERVATLEGLPESIFDATLKRVSITKGAVDLINAIHRNGGKVGAVSGGFSQVLTPLAQKLSLDFDRANQLEVIAGRLTGRVIGQIVDRQAKADALIEWSSASGFELSNTVAVGDGANDLGMMEIAGTSVAFNAKPVVREFADVVLDEPDLGQLIEILKLA